MSTTQLAFAIYFVTFALYAYVWFQDRKQAAELDCKITELEQKQAALEATGVRLLTEAAALNLARGAREGD
jgi:uncharacterized membrane protein